MGWDVITVDGFADVDTIKVSSSSWCLPLSSKGFSASHLRTCLARLRSKFPNAHVLLGAGAEHLAAWVQEQKDWVLCSCQAGVVDKINTPETFFSALEELEIPFPRVSLSQKVGRNEGAWLYKQAGLCGGLGVSRSFNQSSAKCIGYWQQELSGDAISALYITDGMTRQCVGFSRIHTVSIGDDYPYVYAGAETLPEVDKSIMIKTDSYAEKVIKHFNIKGVFGIDMLLADPTSSEKSHLYVLEINPRISATFELYQHVSQDLNLVDAHIRVCEGERLSKLALSKGHYAYRIIFAPYEFDVPAKISWPHWCKDIPEAGRRIDSGEPICSIFADADYEHLALVLDEREKIVLNKLNQIVK